MINLTPEVLSGLLYGIWLWFYYFWVSLAKKLMPEAFHKSVVGDTVVVTGGGSGIGRLMARQLAHKGARIVTLDINEKGNEETVRLIRASGGEAFDYRCDLSKKEDVYEVAARVSSEHGPVSMLINNAGVVSGKDFLDTPDSRIELTFKVNTLAHFWTLKAFLPGMIEQKKGHIVNIASLAGTVGAKGLVDYCSSKFAAVGLHDSLRVELRAQGHEEYIHHTLVCPFFINTGMFDGVATKMLSMLSPEFVVENVINGILTNTDTVIIPDWFTWVIALKQMIPVEAGMAFGDVLGTSDAMDSFLGRAKQA